ncbi:MAG TPA: hypothetical protein VEW65_10740 [Chryseolinea sp.]|nr:hypothetical protein [Chryseolinea sp.]
METYLQTAWGDQWENVDMTIVKMAIKGIKEMDDEHGAFWVGLMKEEENVLEVHKDLELFGVFEDDPGIQYKGRGKDWSEIAKLFETFLAGKIDIVKSKLSKEK